MTFQFGSKYEKNHPKSIWKWSDDELKNTYGECWEIARQLITEHKYEISSGSMVNWGSSSWRGQPATENQMGVLFANGIQGNYDKLDASILIDKLVFEARLNSAVDRYNKKVQREAEIQAKKEAKQKAKEEAKAKRDYELKVKNSANIDKVRKSFEKMWNEFLADDKFSEVEIYKLKQWCLKHIHLNDDFSKMIDICDKVIEDHVVDEYENMELYTEAVAMISRMIHVD